VSFSPRGELVYFNNLVDQHWPTQPRTYAELKDRLHELGFKEKPVRPGERALIRRHLLRASHAPLRSDAVVLSAARRGG
jgi:hypothetical protein